MHYESDSQSSSKMVVYRIVETSVKWETQILIWYGLIFLFLFILFYLCLFKKKNLSDGSFEIPGGFIVLSYLWVFRLIWEGWPPYPYFPMAVRMKRARWAIIQGCHGHPCSHHGNNRARGRCCKRASSYSASALTGRFPVFPACSLAGMLLDAY